MGKGKEIRYARERVFGEGPILPAEVAPTAYFVRDSEGRLAVPEGSDPIAVISPFS